MTNNSVASYPQILSAFAGAGGLDLGVRIIAPSARTVVYIEREARAAVNLVARMEDQTLDEAPVWDQVETFNGRPWRDVVHWIIASPPCQPFSLAGKKRGDTDPRAFGEGDGPLPGLLRVIAEVRPDLVFLENVPAWVTAGWFRSFGDVLAGMGYTIAQPVFLAASDLGFPHKRERVFILAYTENANRGHGATGQPAGAGIRRGRSRGPGTDMGDTHGERRGKAGGGGTRKETRPASADAVLADTTGDRSPPGSADSPGRDEG